jgi:hypothetical protein
MDELAAHVPKMLSLSVAAAVATFPRQSSRTARRADPAERRVNVRADLVPFQSLRGNKVNRQQSSALTSAVRLYDLEEELYDRPQVVTGSVTCLLIPPATVP